MTRIGLIAGQGDLPSIWARAARAKGKEIYAFPLFEDTQRSLAGLVDQINYINIGALDSLIRALLVNEIDKVVMMGKVEKTILFNNFVPDGRMGRLLENLEMLNDDNILLGIVNELADEGIEVISQSTFMEHLLAEEGVLTSAQPDQDVLEDMYYGFKMAREIGRLDIGQTVVVKRKAVLAVEAIEGTDKAIIRAGQLGGSGAVVAKVSKPQQDWRFDLPTVGKTTLKNLKKIKARGLVLEAGKTFLLNKDKFIKEAEEMGLAIMAMAAARVE